MHLCLLLKEHLYLLRWGGVHKTQEERSSTLSILAVIERLAVNGHLSGRLGCEDANDGVSLIDPFGLEGEAAGRGVLSNDLSGGGQDARRRGFEEIHVEQERSRAWFDR